MSTATSVKSFFITTLGCPKNVADSEHVRLSLMSEGLEEAKSPEKSDFHLINTCTFIQSATEETIDTIIQAGKIKKKRKQKLIVLGCFAERYSDAIRSDIPEVDLNFGTGKYSIAGSILKTHFPEEFNGLHEINRNNLNRDKKRKTTGKPYAYVKVSDGCNRGCHFCIIPNLRGSFRDQPEEGILQDAASAVSAGAKEICIVSQDTVFYGKDTDRLKSVLDKISQLNGVEILRLLYLYPDKKTYNLLDYFKENEKLAPYLESPIQHVSEKMLKRMNRSGSFSFFADLFGKAREMRKGLEIRTSLILGYPGETEDDLEETVRFIKEVKPEKLALFAFSPQEGTKAAELVNEVPEEEAARRVNYIREVHLDILKDIHQDRIGKIYPAIVDEVSKDQILVRRFQDAPEIDEIVFTPFQKDLSVGQIGKVKIGSFLEYDMEGEFLH